MTNAQNAAHTPGPWAMAPDAINCLIYRGKPDRNIAIVYDAGARPNRHHEEAVATARLIAAAPNTIQRLEAAAMQLESAVVFLREFGHLGMADACESEAANARAAIAKATGAQP